MNSANPLWGAPRIHGELFKLGIEVSQATVAKYMVRRAGTPSPTWRSFLRNEAIGIAVIDMFVAVSASFRLLYVMVILAHGRRKIVRFDVTRHPTAAWLAQRVIEAFPWQTAPSFLVALGLGLAACQKGLVVGFTTAAALVHELIEARDEKRLLRLQRRLAGLKLLIIDELGYVPLSPRPAPSCFRGLQPALRARLDHRHQQSALR